MSLKIIFVSALDAAEELISVLPDVKNTDIIKKPVDEEHFLHSVRAPLFLHGIHILLCDIIIY